MKNKINILIADDSEKIIYYVKKSLSESVNIQIIESADTLPTAQVIIRKEKTDVVVLDIQLPDGNGIDFLKWIKYSYPKIRVIMFTNNSDDVHRAIAKEYGADYFFDKSFEFEQMIKTISELHN